MQHELPTSHRDDRSASTVSVFRSGGADFRPDIVAVGTVSYGANLATTLIPNCFRDRAHRQRYSGAVACWPSLLRAFRFERGHAFHFEHRWHR
jgi:hypothetical protein